MSGHTIGEMHAVMLRSLAAFHDFCTQHELRYYLIGGSLIGAVRHQGPIPWDDDIDIGMPREDYRRFQELRSSYPSAYRVSFVDADRGYIYPFSKIYDLGTTVTERLSFDFTRGVWLDVFPLDGTYESRRLQALHIQLARVLKGGFATITGAYVPDDCSPSVRMSRAVVRWLARPVPVSWLHSALHRFLSRKPFESSAYVANLLGRWGKREVCRRQVFEKAVTLPFANYRFNAPVGYDEYLRGVYGDYMKLPPEAARVPVHSTTRVSLTSSFVE